MKLLYVTNGFPFPLLTGVLRHYHFIRYLAQRHDVSLFSLVGADHRPEHREGITPYAGRIETVTSSARGRSTLRRLVSRAERVTGIGDRDARRLRTEIRLARRHEAFDAAVFSGRRTEPVVDALDGLPIVVDLCDASSVRILAERQYAGRLRWPQLTAEYLAMRRVEDELSRRADHLLFASARDRDLVATSLHARPSTILPNGVDSEYWTRRSDQIGRDDIVFTGRMDYGPNVDAATQLARTILPLVRREVPDARVRIVGADPTPAVLALANDPAVTVTGTVSDMRPHLESAAVFACPLRWGVGIQNKLLEAMAMAVPVVVSSLAAAGIRTETRGEPPVAIADAPEAFAAEVARAIRAAREGRSPDVSARQYVTTHFDWAAVGRRLEGILVGLVEERSP
jgi:glycosyltransferase involved in cell wall biosynthesis